MIQTKTKWPAYTSCFLGMYITRCCTVKYKEGYEIWPESLKNKKTDSPMFDDRAFSGHVLGNERSRHLIAKSLALCSAWAEMNTAGLSEVVSSGIQRIETPCTTYSGEHLRTRKHPVFTVVLRTWFRRVLRQLFVSRELQSFD